MARPKQFQAAHADPARLAARRLETARRLRLYRNAVGSLKIRMQPYVWDGVKNFHCLPGQSVMVTVAEAVDVADLMAATIRLWQCWRPDRRRTDTSKESVRRAWELFERAALDLRP